MKTTVCRRSGMAGPLSETRLDSHERLIQSWHKGKEYGRSSDDEMDCRNVAAFQG